MKGLLKNTNTIEDFQKLDRKALFEEVSKKVIPLINIIIS